MAIDTTVQPWIVKMLTPADGRVLGEAINRFAEGAATGYLSAKRNARNEIIAEGGVPEPEGNLERVVRLANPQAVSTLDEVLSKDLHTIGQETGKLKTAQEIFNWVAQNAALSASPQGQRILSTISENGRRMAAIEADSAGHVAAVELAKKRAQLMVKYNLPPNATKEQWASITSLENEQEFTERAARIMEKDVSGLITPQDFDANGNWLPGAQQRILKSAPLSQDLQSRERVAALRRETQFSPTDVMKNLEALADAETKGDSNAISALRKKLELDGLSQIDLIKFRSELRELESNILLPDDEKAKRREEIYRKYSAPRPTSGPTSERRIKVTRPDGTTGTVPESRVKDLPSDWKTELDKG